MKRVFAAGTFDGLHEGHRDFLRQAKAHGDELVVVVACDATVEGVKGHRPLRSEDERLKAVAMAAHVDKALLGHPGGDRFAILADVRPDIVFLGYDQGVAESELRVRLDAYGLSTTEIHRGKPHKSEVYKSSKLDQQSG